MKQSLPGIKNISVLPCAGIPQHAMAKCLSDIPVGLNCNTSNLDIYPESSLEVESNYTNGDYYENLTLKFTSTTRIPKQRKMALVITDTEGHNYLIGTKDRPFPVIEYTREISGSRNIYDIKVTFSGKRALIPCAI